MINKKFKCIMKNNIVIILLFYLLISNQIVYANEKGGSNLNNIYIERNINYDTLYNYVDGYALDIYKNMKLDFSNSKIMTSVQDNSRKIDIFVQDCQKVSVGGYVNYSNKFLNNTYDHRFYQAGWKEIYGNKVYVTQWERKKLKKITNDRNYYITFDIIKGKKSYSIFIKSSNPINEKKEIDLLLKNIRFFNPTSYGKIETKKMIKKDWNNETNLYYKKNFIQNEGIVWGIFEPDTAIGNYSELKKHERFLGYEFPILLNYSEFENTKKHKNLEERLAVAKKNGKVLELTLQTPIESFEYGNKVYKILDGEYDEFLENYGKVLADYKHPVIFRLANEMNGDWCPYSSYNTSKDTDIYVNFYRYVYEKFKEAGANNVIWVWNPNGESFPNFKWNNSIMYYPGDEYVDVVGMTAYNTGTYYHSVGEKWSSFDELYLDLYREYCINFDKPLMITEFGSAKEGGNKIEWVETMFKSIKNYKRIKAAIWWDGCDWDKNGNIARSYFIDDTPYLMDVFKRNLKKPWYDKSYA